MIVPLYTDVSTW